MTSTTPAPSHAVEELEHQGQSIWLDYIRRSLITSGELKRLIDEDGLSGVTSNPSIFEKAIVGSTDYRDVLDDPESRKLSAKELYEKLAIRDIQDAADLLRPVYERSKGVDGYVSLEVSPLLARDTDGTVEEARWLWKTVGRKNLMVKVPGTEAGIPAIRRLISEGININVTLLFALETYAKVAEAYLAGLEEWTSHGGDAGKVSSVASFFVSRIDTAVDRLLEGRLKETAGSRQQATLRGLFGKAATASAKLAYQRYQKIHSGGRWESLAKKGARPQRLLWASTSTKNPAYRDVLYVEELIGADTINTIPPGTLNAFRDHGKVRASLTEDVKEASRTIEMLAKAHVSMKDVTDRLVEEGVKQFDDAFEKLLEATGQRAQDASSMKITGQTFKLPSDLEAAVSAALEEWQRADKVRRLWRRDATLWTGADEGEWLDWLNITEAQLAHVESLKRIAEEVRASGFTHALLLGMGGSSLCPEVLRLTFGKIPGYPDLHVLDSTDPAQIKAMEQRVDLGNTLFIVSSKSGTTLEPNIFKQYFFERVKQLVGAEKAGQRFIAITDPGSKMQHTAESDGFRQVFPGVPGIGGRYSALSNFGMVPAAIVGVDVSRFLNAAEEMVHACGATVPARENPGVVLGAILGEAGRGGRDKVTIVCSPGIYDLGAWLEQLLAESTGKSGKGLIPVERERLGSPEVYGRDRVFTYLRLESAPDNSQDAALERLESAGHPVVRIAVREPYGLAGEFFRWEIATAVAGSIIGINAFNQPDVEASKIATRELTAEYEKAGSLPAEAPFFEGDGFKLFADSAYAALLKKSVSGDLSVDGYLRAHVDRLGAGDYFALLAYVERKDGHETSLQRIRHAVRDAKRVATCLGFGPRFLHSTGQAYKGGPNTGVFVQVTCDDAVELEVPGQRYTFGVVKAAQARGDFQVLASRGRRALRVHMGADVEGGLQRLESAIRRAMGQTTP